MIHVHADRVRNIRIAMEKKHSLAFRQNEVRVEIYTIEI